MSVMNARDILESTDWSHLIHAYGTGADNVAELRTLLGGDRAAMRSAVDALDGAYLHQSSIFPATPPAVAFVLAVLAEWGSGAAELPVTPDLLAWVEEVGWSLYPYLDDVRSRTLDQGAQDRIAAALDAGELDWEEHAEDLDQVLGNAALGLLELAPTAVRVLSDLPVAPARELDRAAVGAAIPWVIIAGDDRAASILVTRLEQLPDDLTPAQLASVVRSLADLGADVTRWLRHEHPGVRAFAAMQCPGSEEAAEVLVEALRHPEEIAGWFDHWPSDGTRWTGTHVLCPALARFNLPLERIAPAAAAVIRASNGSFPEYEWYPLVRDHFATTPATLSERRLPKPLTAAHKEILQAMVDNDAIWDQSNGNMSVVRRSMGINIPRSKLRARL